MTGARSSRRGFLAGSLAAAGLAALPWRARGEGAARVVVVGGGFAGATCARYLRLLEPALEVVLVEPAATIATCPFSNLVLGGERRMRDLYQGFATLAAHGVRVVRDAALAVESDRHRVRLAGGGVLAYERAVVAPGIELRFDAVPGYDAAAAQRLPHAWQAGRQTRLLRRQLAAMADGGVVIIAPPGEPFRCPPGPYERASLIAHYLTRHKPRSKILILDAKDGFSKQALFEQGWAARYPGMIEWVPGSDGGLVERVDAATRTLVTESGFTEQRGDVVNFIPPQRAAAVARASGLTDASGWCPIEPESFASTLAPDVHVLGDAAVAGAMPKSAFSANNQAKVCAAAIVTLLRGQAPVAASYANTCYSLVAPDYGISISAVYRVADGNLTAVEGAGGVSPLDADAHFRAREAAYAYSWYDTITADSWG